MKISSVQKIGVIRHNKNSAGIQTIAIALDFLPPFDMASGFNEQLFAVLLGSHTVPLTGIKIGARKTKNTFQLICRKSGNHGV
jgi:hypothetical protein